MPAAAAAAAADDDDDNDDDDAISYRAEMLQMYVAATARTHARQHCHQYNDVFEVRPFTN